MLEPILEDIGKLYGQFKTALLIITLVALSFWVARCTAAKDAVVAERVKVLTHEVKVLVPVYITDTVIAYRTRIKYETARITDTVTRNDSVFVYRPAADAAINACAVALHDCEHLRIVNDSLIHLQDKQKPGFWSHFACVGGGGALSTLAGKVSTGVGVICGPKLW